MVTAPSEGTLDEVITRNITGVDRNINLQKQTSLAKLRKRLRKPILVDTLIFVIGKSINSHVIEIYKRFILHRVHQVMITHTISILIH